MKKVFPFVLAALMIPSVALAKGSPERGDTHEPRQGEGHVRAQGHDLRLHGVRLLDADERFDHDRRQQLNRHGKLLDGQTIQLTVGPNTKLRLLNGVTSIAAAQPGDSARSRSAPRAWPSRAPRSPTCRPRC